MSQRDKERHLQSWFRVQGLWLEVQALLEQRHEVKDLSIKDCGAPEVLSIACMHAYNEGPLTMWRIVIGMSLVLSLINSYKEGPPSYITILLSPIITICGTHNHI